MSIVRSKAGVAMLTLGLAAYFVGHYGVYHYRDEATKHADDLIQEHLPKYKPGDFSRAVDGYLEQTRTQQMGFYILQFSGLALACWCASKLRKRAADAVM